MKKVKLSSSTTAVLKNGEYFIVKHNSYAGSKNIYELEFDNGIAEIRTGSNSVRKYQKKKLDVLFELANKKTPPT